MGGEVSFKDVIWVGEEGKFYMRNPTSAFGVLASEEDEKQGLLLKRLVRDDFMKGDVVGGS